VVEDSSGFRGVFKMFGLLPSVSSSGSPFGTPNSLFNVTLPKFVVACNDYNKKTGLVPVLVIDNADNFCDNEEGRQFLGRLRSLAKEWAVSFAKWMYFWPCWVYSG
jgi:hypothetical protein